MKRSASIRETGISLVELLLGLAITALVMAPLVPMLQTASAATRIAGNRTALEQEADFALARIAARIRATAPPADLSKPPAEWLAPAVYTVVGGALLEQQGKDSYILANSVTSISFSTPAAEGTPLVTASLTLKRDDTSTTAAATVRMGTAR